ncbi:MAG: M14 family metallopeptidase [Candidatus Aminicenantes bacterium]|nr:M14 family metallopeptidase [Candidatus Aminicenantes bacterium]
MLFALIFFLFSGKMPAEETNPELLTAAESSNFTATMTHAEVLTFIRTLQKKSSLFRVETLCFSPEGRYVPLLVVGNPIPNSPLELRNDKRAVIYIQANIHAGEVEGKEASLMLLRDILLQENPPYLDRLIILLAPDFNADGNDKISPQNRRNQVGPEKGVGVRYNGQNLDLNRDAVKMESPELQGLLKNVLLRWDPALLVDCHTTNGSYHEEPVTYLWGINPNTDKSITLYMRDQMLPAIQNHLKEKYDVLSIPYGNFMLSREPETAGQVEGWRPAGPEARYITNYIGLRNRLSILNENYAYADYKTRVYGCYYFLKSIFDYCHSHAEEIARLVQEADRNTKGKGLSSAEEDGFILESEPKPLKTPITILGYEMEVIQREGSWPRIRRTDTKKTYTLPHYADFVPTHSIVRPRGYLIPLHDNIITQKLLQHGLTIEKLVESADIEVEAFQLTEIKGEERIFQGHRTNSVKGKYKTQVEHFPAGTLFVSTAQPLGNLVCHLLEAESDDGLLAWNFFDNYIVAQWGRQPQDYPVYRLHNKQVKLVKETISH